MKLAIIGSRGYNNYEQVSAILNEYKSQVVLVISGGAKGADTLGEKWALENNIETLIFPADWDKYGKRAGYIRNEDIVKNCDFVIAFWDGKSKGTANSIALANKYNKPIKIINV
jgi:hypothetical protein